MKNDFPDSIIELPGYDLFGRDRIDSKGGGACIYIKKLYTTHPSDCYKYFTPQEIDFLSINLNIGSAKLLTSCIFIQGRTSDEDFTALVLRSLTNDREPLIFGDFN